MRSAVQSDQTAPDREVLTELNALHARTLRRMPWVLAAVMLAIGATIYRPQFVRPFAIWAVMVVAMESMRAFYANAVLHLGDEPDPRTVHRWLVILAGLAGATLGLGAAYFLPLLSMLDQTQLAIFLFAIPAAGVAVSQSSRYIGVAYCITILFPGVAVWVNIHPSLFWSGVIGAPIFCLLMFLVAADGDKLLRRSVVIRHERDRLVQDLEDKNAEVQIARAKAEAAALSRARVLAAASHDLRQPLHALSVYSAVLTARPDPAVLTEVGGHIVDIVRSLGSVLNGLLDLSRLSSGNYVPEVQQFSLDTTLTSVCAEFFAAARAKGIELQLDLKPTMVKSDEVGIGRIARNLIDNAIKYTDSGSVRVTTALAEGMPHPRAVLTVTDTGQGISQEDQKRIFEEFYQVDNPGRDRNQGVGLGLAIVHRLGEMLDATISVSSVPGKGSVFELSLPAVSVPDLLAVRANSQEEAVDMRGKRVFVVDDELDVLRGTQALLNTWGLEVHCANTAQAAERLCQQAGTPDLMIADLRLGKGEHGAQLAARLQQTFGAFPVLIVSGETSSAALEAANRLSFPLLHKPVRPEVLRSAVAAALATADSPVSVAAALI